MQELKKYFKSNSELIKASLKYVLQQQGVSVIIPGAKNIEQVKENLVCEEKDLSASVVSGWSNIYSCYCKMFDGFKIALDSFVSDCDHLDIEGGDGRKLGFSLAVFDGQIVYDISLQLYHVKGFDLLGSIEIQTNPKNSDGERVSIPINTHGVILDNESLKPICIIV